MKMPAFTTILASTAIVKNQKQEYLLLRRGGTAKIFRGYWQLPEGRLDDGEIPDLTLSRELFEETGIKTKVNNIHTITNTKINTLGLKFYILRFVYKISVKSNKVVLSNEHTQYKWLTKKQALKLKLVPGTKELLI